MREKRLTKTKQLFLSNLVQYQRAAIYQKNNHSIFVSPIFTSCLVGNIIIYTPIQSTNRENYFNHTI